LGEENKRVDACGIEYCISIIEDISSRAELEKEKKIKFICEQLQLLNDKIPRYSSFLLANSVLWENTSPALYKQILRKNIISLPSVRHIRRLASSVSTESGLTDSAVSYLKARIKNLSQSDKTISVLVDEVYSAKRGEYKAGKFYGAENMEATKTLMFHGKQHW